MQCVAGLNNLYVLLRTKEQQSEFWKHLFRLNQSSFKVNNATSISYINGFKKPFYLILLDELDGQTADLFVSVYLQVALREAIISFIANINNQGCCLNFLSNCEMKFTIENILY